MTDTYWTNNSGGAKQERPLKEAGWLGLHVDTHGEHLPPAPYFLMVILSKNPLGPGKEIDEEAVKASLDDLYLGSQWSYNDLHVMVPPDKAEEGTKRVNALGFKTQMDNMFPTS